MPLTKAFLAFLHGKVLMRGLFVFLFVEKCVILVLRPCPPTSIGGEVRFMVHFLAILESVVADVISHYICKWLDRFDKDRKPD